MRGRDLGSIRQLLHYDDLQIKIDISGTQDFLLNPQETRNISINDAKLLESLFDVTTIGNNIDDIKWHGNSHYPNGTWIHYRFKQSSQRDDYG